MAAHAEEFDQWAMTFTFCECAENGPGMEKLGRESVPGGGLNADDLLAAKESLERAGIVCELIDLVAAGKVEALAPEPAFLLVMRGALPYFLGAGGEAAAGAAAAEAAAAGAAAGAASLEQAVMSFVEEQRPLEDLVDKKAIFRGMVKNKNARWNLCMADRSQEPCYEEGRGRIIDFAQLPNLSAVRSAIPQFFNPEKTTNLLAEANYYFNTSRTGIGFHGDTERRIVIALRIGLWIPLHYQWYQRHKPCGERIVIELHAGDMYAMSEKAVGKDWKRSVIPTLRHAAGGAVYLS